MMMMLMMMMAVVMTTAGTLISATLSPVSLADVTGGVRCRLRLVLVLRPVHPKLGIAINEGIGIYTVSGKKGTDSTLNITLTNLNV